MILFKTTKSEGWNKWCALHRIIIRYCERISPSVLDQEAGKLSFMVLY